MGRPSGPKTRCSGQWTEAKFNTFIRNVLRQATRKWGPKNEIKKEANLRRGIYKCNGCGKEVAPTIRQGRKRVTNVFVDHIEPVINPETGFTTWDEFVDRMFCEKDNLQLLCGKCHDEKTIEERALSAKYRKIRKEQ